jgi:serine protease
MRRLMIVLAVGGCAALGLSRARLQAQGGFVDLGPIDHVPGQVVVQFQGLAAAQGGEARVAELVRAGGGIAARASGFSAGLHLVTLAEGDPVPAAVSRFSRLPDVAFAEPNYVQHLYKTPNDPLFAALQWNFRMLDSTRLWDIQSGSSSVVVAVIDSGVASQEVPALFVDYGQFGSGILGPFGRAPDWGNTRFAAGFNAVLGGGPPYDDNGHGTHVASTIAEGTDNGLGVTGLAFGVTIMPVKACFFVTGTCLTFDQAESIDFATRNGAKVINMSLGGSQASEIVRLAVQRAAAAGVVVVAASGNENGAVGFPAAFPEVIAVGAVDRNKNRAFYSNFGPQLDFVAPGGDVRVDADADGIIDGIFQQTYPEAFAQSLIFTQFSIVPKMGTSMASPHVAAVVALLISQGITDPAAIRAALEATAEDLGPAGFDNQFGHGLVQPVQALRGLGLNR